MKFSGDFYSDIEVISIILSAALNRTNFFNLIFRFLGDFLRTEEVLKNDGLGFGSLWGTGGDTFLPFFNLEKL